MKRKAITSAAEILNLVVSKPLDFRPGDKWDFSNTNYIVFGLLIGRLSGKSYGQFMAEEVFSPLGMTSTIVPTDIKSFYCLAQGYDKSGNKAELFAPGWSYADGGIVSSVAVLAKWGVALQNASLLKRENLELMWTPALLSDGAIAKNFGDGYGFGWHLLRNKESGHKFVEHGGGTFAFRSSVPHELEVGRPISCCAI